MNLGKEPIPILQKGGEIMKEFWSLFRESVILQGCITLAFVVTTCYLWVTGQAVPQELWTANTIVLAFFFGSKYQSVIQSKGK